jgi:hypothetical protein
MTQLLWRLISTLAVATLALAAASASALRPQVGPEPQARDPQIGQSSKHDRQIGRSFQVPYRLTETNHFLVRVRINGKGPFNFLVDSGAPALFITTETAKKINLKPPPGEFWALVDRLDLEGGARLTGLKARVEDPFQLVGMNALGLPGTSIDGILGFTILARFRLEIDLTKDRMTWTRLDYEPRDPPGPKRNAGAGASPPLEIQALSALGPLAKGLAFLMGKQPEEERHPRGFLGLEWSEQVESGQAQLEVRAVLEGTPAARAGLKSGDRIVRIKDRAIRGVKEARVALAQVRPGDQVALIVLRGSGAGTRRLSLNLTAGEGL